MGVQSAKSFMMKEGIVLTYITVGELREIHRYPVKSFAGESLESSKIDSYGLYGDRSHAFVDVTKEGWNKYFTARHSSRMLGYKAALVGEGTVLAFPEVEVISPDGRMFHWDERLLEEIQAFSKKKLSMLSHESGSSQLLAVDTGSILIVTDRSLRELERIWGKGLDKRRFRANLVVVLSDDAPDESEWIGKKLRVGTAELQTDSFCERCSMITIDPETLESDPTLLKTVNKELGLNFGVYASVVQTGEVNVGDKVYLAKG